MPALVALKNTFLQIFDGMRGSPSQMRVAAALATAKRCNKFVILHNKGMLFHTSPRPSLSANAEPARHPRRRLRTPPSLSPDQLTIIRLEDGEERAIRGFCRRGQNLLTHLFLIQGCRFEEAALSRDDLTEVERRILKVLLSVEREQAVSLLVLP
jgi:hypothetical protein